MNIYEYTLILSPRPPLSWESSCTPWERRFRRSTPPSSSFASGRLARQALGYWWCGVWWCSGGVVWCVVWTGTRFNSGGVPPSPHFLHNMPEVLICPSWLCVGIKGQGKNKTINFNFISASLLCRSTLSKLISPNEVGAAFSLV